jgi:hypothetical protein
MRIVHAAILVIVSAMSPATDAAAASAGGTLSVPTQHPRLWLSTPQLRQRAATWLTTTGALPQADDYVGNAFVSVLTGDPARCAAPVNWLVTFTLPDIGNVSSDNSRWYGEYAALVFDWCFAAMSPEQRTLVINRWNGYLDTLHAKPWGGQGFAENNYFWGYLRNNINWAIATWHENPHAPALLEAGMGERFDNWFLLQHQGVYGQGGVPGEGTQYGRYMLGYPVVPFLTLRDYGIDLYGRTNYFNSAIYYMLFSTSPRQTPSLPSQPACDERYWYLMPFNDDEAFLYCEPEVAKSGDYAMHMLAMSEVGAGAQRDHAQHWYSQVQPTLPFWARFRAPTGGGAGVDALPLDYFAPGPGYLWVRSGRQESDSVALLQLGAHGGVGHRHNDTGTFQFWRDGEWISRETTGYTDMIPGYAGGPLVDVLNAVGHNSVLFEGQGERSWTSGGPREIPPGTPRGSNPDGRAQVTRVHHHGDFLYAAVDLSRPYRAALSGDPCRYDWPFAESAIREFIFVRAMNVLVVFDRLRSGSDSQQYTNSYCQSVGFTNYAGPVLAADAVRKAFVAHFGRSVSLNGDVATAAAGVQWARVETLWPENYVRRVIDERNGNPSSLGQYRLEIEASGQPLTHFLHTIQSTRPGESPATASLDTGAAVWQLLLSKPGMQPVSIELTPGEFSIGGAISRGGERTEFLDRVQDTWIDENGPHWEDLDAAAARLFRDGFE